MKSVKITLFLLFIFQWIEAASLAAMADKFKTNAKFRTEKVMNKAVRLGNRMVMRGVGNLKDAPQKLINAADRLGSATKARYIGLKETAKKLSNVADRLVRPAAKFQKDVPPGVTITPEGLRANAVPMGAKMTLEGDTLTFGKYLGGGAYGKAYKLEEFIINGKKRTDVVLKTLYNENPVEFNRELLGLSTTGNLVKAYPKEGFLLQKEIKGNTLQELIAEAMRNNDQNLLSGYKSAYDKLADQFYKDYGLFHGDIRPPNVIVKPNGEMQLIDFGRTTSVYEFLGGAQDTMVNLKKSGFDPAHLRKMNQVYIGYLTLRKARLNGMLNEEKMIATREWDYSVLKSEFDLMMAGPTRNPEIMRKYWDAYLRRYGKSPW